MVCEDFVYHLACVNTGCHHLYPSCKPQVSPVNLSGLQVKKLVNIRRFLPRATHGRSAPATHERLNCGRQRLHRMTSALTWPLIFFFLLLASSSSLSFRLVFINRRIRADYGTLFASPSIWDALVGSFTLLPVLMCIDLDSPYVTRSNVPHQQPLKPSQLPRCLPFHLC